MKLLRCPTCGNRGTTHRWKGSIMFVASCIDYRCQQPSTLPRRLRYHAVWLWNALDRTSRSAGNDKCKKNLVSKGILSTKKHLSIIVQKITLKTTGKSHISKNNFNTEGI